MKFDDELLDYLCELSKLSLKEGERDEILESLKNLVEEFSIISSLEDDQTNIQNNRYLSLREDIPINCEDIDKLKDNFPSTEEEFLESPKILNEDN